MRFILETDDHMRIEIREIDCVGKNSDALLVFTDVYLSKKDKQKFQSEIEEATGRRCLLLPPYIRKIVGVQADGSLSQEIVGVQADGNLSRE